MLRLFPQLWFADGVECLGKTCGKVRTPEIHSLINRANRCREKVWPDIHSRVQNARTAGCGERDRARETTGSASGFSKRAERATIKVLYNLERFRHFHRSYGYCLKELDPS